MKTESVPHPTWLRTYMFGHRVVSWTVEQSSCIFSVTIAGSSVPIFGNGQNNTKTRCICLYRVQFPTYFGKPSAIFSTVVKVRQTSRARIPADCVCLAKLALVAFRLFPRPLWFHATECCGAVGEGTSECRYKSVPTWWSWGPISACAAHYSAARVLMLLLSSLLLMLSG